MKKALAFAKILLERGTFQKSFLPKEAGA